MNENPAKSSPAPRESRRTDRPPRLPWPRAAERERERERERPPPAIRPIGSLGSTESGQFSTDTRSSTGVLLPAELIPAEAPQKQERDRDVRGVHRPSDPSAI